MKDLDNPSDEGKHTLGLSVSDSPHFCAQSQSCLSLLVSEAMPVFFCIYENSSVCVFVCTWRACGRYWKRCQLDVGVQTDGRQASGQLAFTAFHKPFTPNASPPYPHSVILAFALFLFFSQP